MKTNPSAKTDRVSFEEWNTKSNKRESAISKQKAF